MTKGFKLKLFLAIAAVGAGVAVTYLIFEKLVRVSSDYIWNDWLDTDVKRWLIVPLIVVLSLIYFGAQHLWDKSAEQKTEHGLGTAPKPTLANFIKVLGIGFLSLIAGVSLGPEAILVPASMLVGLLIGKYALASQDPKLGKLLSLAGFAALFVAFFNTLLGVAIGLYLVHKIQNIKLTRPMIIVSLVAGTAAALVLQMVPSKSYLGTPGHTWNTSLWGYTSLIVLVALGYLATLVIDKVIKFFGSQQERLAIKKWWSKAIIAGVGLSLIYLVGGPLTQFTGNESIIPLSEQASSLGLFGILWVLIAKVLAIGWSKAFGYRGGLVFPSLFVVSGLVIIMQQYVQLSFVYGFIAATAGLLWANNKTDALF